MSVRFAVDLPALPVAERLPWTRARATRTWRLALAILASVRLAALMLIPKAAGIPLGELLSEIVAAAVFPALFIAIVTFCERRFLRRPPKTLLSAQLACFCTGATLQLVAILGEPALATLANLVFLGSTLLIGGWFVGVLLVPED